MGIDLIGDVYLGGGVSLRTVARTSGVSLALRTTIAARHSSAPGGGGRARRFAVLGQCRR